MTSHHSSARVRFSASSAQRSVVSESYWTNAGRSESGSHPNLLELRILTALALRMSSRCGAATRSRSAWMRATLPSPRRADGATGQARALDDLNPATIQPWPDVWSPTTRRSAQSTVARESPPSAA
jgi:hypothetical protein